MPQSLNNKTILITRSADQVTDFATQLQNLGANIIKLPLIQTNPIFQKKIPKKIDQFDWIIFTSINAVKYFFNTISISFN